MNFPDLLRIEGRRAFLRDCAGGIGTIALSHLLAAEGRTTETDAAKDPLAVKPPHFPAKAKNVIFLFMAGAPSQLDLFDPKPGLQKWHGKPLPASMTKDLKLAFIKPTATIMASPRQFQPYGKCGMEISDYLPHTATCADDICLVRSTWSEAFNHHPCQSMLMSKNTPFSLPTIGSSVHYEFGNQSRNLSSV